MRLRLIFVTLLITMVSIVPAGLVCASSRSITSLNGPWRIKAATPAALRHAVILSTWKWQRAELGLNSPPRVVPEDLSQSVGWKLYKSGSNVLGKKPGYVWFQTILPPMSHSPRMLEFAGVDTRAVVYVNGKMLTEHRGGDMAFEIPVYANWHNHHPNILTILAHGVGDKIATLQPVKFGTYAPALFPPNEGISTNRSGGWKSVLVPNDFVVQGTFDPKANVAHGYLHVDPVWYRKTFSVAATAKGNVCELCFGAVMSGAVVYLNGQYVGEHADGYAPFRFNVSRFINYGGVNVLTVYVDPRIREGWWYEGGGIYRHVSFMVLNPLHIARWGTFVMSQIPGLIRHNPKTGACADANLIIQTTVHNQTNQRNVFTIVSSVLSPRGVKIGTTKTIETLAAGAIHTFNQTLPVLHAALWSLHHCNLYSLHTEIISGGTAVDTKSTSFGIRSIYYSPNSGFYLNGRHVELKGTCNHQDFPAVGVAAPADLWSWRVMKLKGIGCNAYRCSHNPMGTALYNACDHLGMLVMDENRELGDTRLGGDYMRAKSYPGVPYGNAHNLKAMVLRDRNYPCVIMWSLCNEEVKIEGSTFGQKLFRRMMKIVRKLDPSRPITCAMNGGYPNGFAKVEDLLGINYSPASYIIMHRHFPYMPIFASEMGSSESDRGVLKNNAAKGLVSQYTVHSSWSQLPWNAWKPIGTRKFVAGGFVWTGFDYRGEPTPYQWPDINSHFGLLDICGFAKPDAYYYKAAWTRKPMVYIQPQWDFPRKAVGTPILMRSFSNCQQVELFFNGKSMGLKAMPRFGYVDWHLPWQPGKLLVRGYNNNKLIASYSVQTPGPAARLKMTDEWPDIVADGQSIAPIAVRIVDARGEVVDHAINRVRFRISGPGEIVGTGNGDPASHIPNDAHYSSAFYGRCMVLVRAGNKPGAITVTATCKGLPPTTLNLRTIAQTP